RRRIGRPVQPERQVDIRESRKCGQKEHEREQPAHLSIMRHLLCSSCGIHTDFIVVALGDGGSCWSILQHLPGSIICAVVTKGTSATAFLSRSPENFCVEDS